MVVLCVPLSNNGYFSADWIIFRIYFGFDMLLFWIQSQPQRNTTNFGRYLDSPISWWGERVWVCCYFFLNACLSEFHLRHVGLLWGFWCHLLANIWFNFGFMSWVLYGHFLYLWNFNLFQPKWMMFLMKLMRLLVSTSRPRRQHFFFWQLETGVTCLLGHEGESRFVIDVFLSPKRQRKECNETWSELMWPVRIHYYFSLSLHHIFHVRRVHGDRSLSAQHTS